MKRWSFVSVALVTVFCMLGGAPRAMAVQAPSPSPTATMEPTEAPGAATPTPDFTPVPGQSVVNPAPSASPALVAAPSGINMRTACRMLANSPKLQSHAKDDHILAAYDDERRVQREIALEYYHCADSLAGRTDTRARYVHDEAQLMYATWMFRALPKPAPDEALAQTSSVVAALENSTVFADVKNAAAALAAQLPAPPPKLDPDACAASGFLGAIQTWYSQAQSYASSYDSMARVGAMKATILSEIAYSAGRGDVSAQLQKMENDAAIARQDEIAIGQANAPETEKVAGDVMTQVDEITGRLAALPSENGYAAAADVSQVKTARTLLDAALDRLRQVPYCQK